MRLESDDLPEPRVRRAVTQVPATRAARVDNASFDAIFAAHHDRLVRLTALLCGDRDQAEDIVAEVFARTYPKWQKGGIDDIGAYLRRGAVNHVKSGWRKKATRRRIDERRRREPEPGLVDDAVNERHRVQAALQELPERQRAVIVLRFFDDRSEADTAAILDMPGGTVKSNVSRGLARLRELLEDGHDG